MVQILIGRPVQGGKHDAGGQDFRQDDRGGGGVFGEEKDQGDAGAAVPAEFFFAAGFLGLGVSEDFLSLAIRVHNLLVFNIGRAATAASAFPSLQRGPARYMTAG